MHTEISQSSSGPLGSVGLIILLSSVLGCSDAGSDLQQAPKSPTPPPIDIPHRVTQVAGGLENPWGLAFLPDGRMLVTERPGRLRIVASDGAMSAPIANVPAVFAEGQGGLLDVLVDPRFTENRTIYLSFSEPDGKGKAGTSVARARLSGEKLTDVEIIFRQRPKLGGVTHFGSRLVLNRDGTLLVTLGDRGESKRAQQLSSTIGKIVRIGTDGTVPADNPFTDRLRARDEIWSYGHRNIQAAALHPDTGQLWTVEHGARGGDELNQPKSGRNYGWPVITYGVDYSGARIGVGTARDGMEQPVYFWDPVIAPSGMMFYTGSAFPEWRGSIFVGSLNPGGIVRLSLDGDQVISEERFVQNLRERVRDVRQGPDGLIYFVTDHKEGRILRIEPANEPAARPPRAESFPVDSAE